MSEEQNQNAEEQLRRYAQERRKQAGGEWEIPRVTASLLRAESERRWRRARARARGFPGGWLPWGLAFALGLAVGFFWQLKGRSDSRRVALLDGIERERETVASKPRSQLENLERKPAVSEPSGTTQLADLRQIGEKPPKPASKSEAKSLETGLEQQNEARRQAASNGPAGIDDLAAPLAASAPASGPAGVAGAASGSVARGGGGARSFNPPATTWFFRNAAPAPADRFASGNGVLFGNLSTEQTPPTPSQPPAGAPGSDKAKYPDLALKPPGLSAGEGVPGISSTALSAGSGTNGRRLAGMMTNDGTLSSEPALGVAAQSSRQSTRLAKRGFQVLDSFYLTRQGNLVTVTDFDGSVYQGNVETAQGVETASAGGSKDRLARSIAPLPEVEETKALAKKLSDHTPVLSNNPVSAQQGASSSNLALYSVSGAPGPLQTTLFRVSGTNLSTQVEVAFEGYVVDGEALEGAKLAGIPGQRQAEGLNYSGSGALRQKEGAMGGGGIVPQDSYSFARRLSTASNNVVSATNAPASPPTVVGLATLGRTNQLEIRANAAPPPAR